MKIIVGDDILVMNKDMRTLINGIEGYNIPTDDLGLANWKITMLLKNRYHHFYDLFLWAMASRAMSNNQMVMTYLYYWRGLYTSFIDV